MDTAPQVDQSIERLDEASWLVANGIRPIARAMTVPGHVTWTFPLNERTRNLLRLFRSSAPGIKLMLGFSEARDRERRTIFALKDAHRGRRGGAR